MKIEPLNLSHQTLLKPRFQKLELHISEYTFANLYLFRQEHNYQLIISNDIYVKGKTRDGLSYLMPTVPIEQFNWPEIEHFLQEDNFLYPIPQMWINNFDIDKFQISHKEEDSDYLYTIHKLSDFPGRNMSGRRNLVTQFNDLYSEHSSTALTDMNTKDALKVLDEWQKLGPEKTSFSDYSACSEALLRLDELSLSGHITYVENNAVGFVLGEKLDSKTYVIHFAKALKQYKGIYQYIYQEFARSLAGQCENINLEQDLGLTDLQQSKRAYYPDQLIPKLRISLCKSKV